MRLIYFLEINNFKHINSEIIDTILTFNSISEEKIPQKIRRH